MWYVQNRNASFTMQLFQMDFVDLLSLMRVLLRVDK